MQLKIKKLDARAVLPSFAKDGDAGMDLTAINITKDNVGNITYHTGISMEIPKGYVGLLFPRSSICKKQQFLTNSVGVVDSGFRGEILAKFKPVMGSYETILELFESNEYQEGDRIVQLMIIKHETPEIIEVKELSDTERGYGGFGSTGD